MNVDLRYRQFHAAADACDATLPPRLSSRLASWFTRAELTRGRTATYSLTMPYVGWVRVQQALLVVVMREDGRRDWSTPGSAGRALQRVQHALNAMNVHPALSAMGLAGEHHHVLPAWRISVDAFDPYPRPDKAFILLEPRQQSTSLGPVTFWMPNDRPPSGSGALLDPQEHLALLTDSELLASA